VSGNIGKLVQLFDLLIKEGTISKKQAAATLGISVKELDQLLDAVQFVQCQPKIRVKGGLALLETKPVSQKINPEAVELLRKMREKILSNNQLP
jgi:hypothetical protein